MMKNRIHNHPKMEKELGVNESHVIIDRELFSELLRRFGDYHFPPGLEANNE